MPTSTVASARVIFEYMRAIKTDCFPRRKLSITFLQCFYPPPRERLLCRHRQSTLSFDVGRWAFDVERSLMHIEPDTLPTGHAGIAARLKKGPTIHSSAWVVSGATVIGDVTLEEESSVWYGAVLRGDINRIIVGPRSNVQDNAVVHLDTNYPTTLGELVTIGHTAVVHACKIDNEVLVGMGAIILDDVEVGARSIIGANALVTIGTKVPPGSLVLGSPAKIRRQLTLDEQKDIARWAWSYVETAKEFREFY
jgi:carbonic anhydrase/acetyltransferase-like protein (isoleucine patch superfamily)